MYSICLMLLAATPLWSNGVWFQALSPAAAVAVMATVANTEDAPAATEGVDSPNGVGAQDAADERMDADQDTEDPEMGDRDEADDAEEFFDEEEMEADDEQVEADPFEDEEIDWDLVEEQEEMAQLRRDEAYESGEYVEEEADWE